MAEPGYTKTQLWTEFDDFVAFLPKPVPQEDKIPENNAIVSFQ